jgi:hypothetical protein
MGIVARFALLLWLAIRLRRGVGRDISTSSRVRGQEIKSYGTTKENGSKETICFIETHGSLAFRTSGISRLETIVSFIYMPRWTDRSFVDEKILMRIVEVEREKERSLWQWHVSVRSAFQLEGRHYSPTAIHTDIVLMAIARNVADPCNRSGPEMWNDAWERRLMWTELQSIRREVLRHVEGPSRTLN